MSFLAQSSNVLPSKASLTKNKVPRRHPSTVKNNNSNSSNNAYKVITPTYYPTILTYGGSNCASTTIMSPSFSSSSSLSSSNVSSIGPSSINASPIFFPGNFMVKNTFNNNSNSNNNVCYSASPNISISGLASASTIGNLSKNNNLNSTGNCNPTALSVSDSFNAMPSFSYSTNYNYPGNSSRALSNNFAMSSSGNNDNSSPYFSPYTRTVTSPVMINTNNTVIESNCSEPFSNGYVNGIGSLDSVSFPSDLISPFKPTLSNNFSNSPSSHVKKCEQKVTNEQNMINVVLVEKQDNPQRHQSISYYDSSHIRQHLPCSLHPLPVTETVNSAISVGTQFGSFNNYDNTSGFLSDRSQPSRYSISPSPCFSAISENGGERENSKMFINSRKDHSPSVYAAKPTLKPRKSFLKGIEKDFNFSDKNWVRNSCSSLPSHSSFSCTSSSDTLNENRSSFHTFSDVISSSATEKGSFDKKRLYNQPNAKANDNIDPNDDFNSSLILSKVVAKSVVKTAEGANENVPILVSDTKVSNVRLTKQFQENDSTAHSFTVVVSNNANIDHRCEYPYDHVFAGQTKSCKFENVRDKMTATTTFSSSASARDSSVSDLETTLGDIKTTATPASVVEGGEVMCVSKTISPLGSTANFKSKISSFVNFTPISSKAEGRYGGSVCGVNGAADDATARSFAYYTAVESSGLKTPNRSSRCPSSASPSFPRCCPFSTSSPFSPSYSAQRRRSGLQLPATAPASSLVDVFTINDDHEIVGMTAEGDVLFRKKDSEDEKGCYSVSTVPSSLPSALSLPGTISTSGDENTENLHTHRGGNKVDFLNRIDDNDDGDCVNFEGRFPVSFDCFHPTTPSSYFPSYHHCYFPAVVPSSSLAYVPKPTAMNKTLHKSNLSYTSDIAENVTHTDCKTLAKTANLDLKKSENVKNGPEMHSDSQPGNGTVIPALAVLLPCISTNYSSSSFTQISSPRKIPLKDSPFSSLDNDTNNRNTCCGDLQHPREVKSSTIDCSFNNLNSGNNNNTHLTKVNHPKALAKDSPNKINKAANDGNNKVSRACDGASPSLRCSEDNFTPNKTAEAPSIGVSGTFASVLTSSTPIKFSTLSSPYMDKTSTNTKGNETLNDSLKSPPQTIKAFPVRVFPPPPPPPPSPDPLYLIASATSISADDGNNNYFYNCGYKDHLIKYSNQGVDTDDHFITFWEKSRVRFSPSPLNNINLLPEEVKSSAPAIRNNKIFAFNSTDDVPNPSAFLKTIEANKEELKHVSKGDVNDAVVKGGPLLPDDSLRQLFSLVYINQQQEHSPTLTLNCHLVSRAEPCPAVSTDHEVLSFSGNENILFTDDCNNDDYKSHIGLISHNTPLYLENEAVNNQHQRRGEDDKENYNGNYKLNILDNIYNNKYDINEKNVEDQDEIRYKELILSYDDKENNPDGMQVFRELKRIRDKRILISRADINSRMSLIGIGQSTRW